MSIINEALKKTEDNLQKNSNQDTGSISPKRINPAVLLLYILILAAGLLIGKFIFSLLSNKTQTDSLTSLNQTSKSQTEAETKEILLPPGAVTQPILPAVAANPLPQDNQGREVNFVLNGIFLSDDGNYALINNKIVKKDDYIENAKVGLITANTVELDCAGKIVTLSTNQ
ncbi:MAG TPA: hypothetical protein PL125_04015 [Candidatus Omnitrophota bacterium]|nr:hypothetical protein [Candidatus Omnitrophota bacterium]HPT39344.1 hypothetical protein [Candidatus Omnitrophota bacterium]